MNVHAFSGYNVGPPPPAAALYGAEAGSATTSDLYTIDPNTAAATSVGPIGFAVTGMSFRPSDGVLFGVTSNNSSLNPRSLITIDTVTGDGTLVGSLGLAAPLGDIAFRSDDVLYGLSSGNYRLHTVNTTTGAATQINTNTPPGAVRFGMGNAFDSADNYYAFPKGSAGGYYDLDETTVTYTLLGTLSGTPLVGAGVSAVSIDQAGVFYGVLSLSGSTSHLVTIDVGTGAITDVGASVASLDAIAWAL